MAKKHGGLYDESPTIKGEEEGKPKVVKPKGKEKSDGASEKAVEEEGFPIESRHANERGHMHVKHEHEHRLHEEKHGVNGKEEMHTRHEKEMKEMHTRHEKEATKHEGSGKEAGEGGAEGKVSEPTKKITKE